MFACERAIAFSYPAYEIVYVIFIVFNLAFP